MKHNKFLSVIVLTIILFVAMELGVSALNNLAQAQQEVTVFVFELQGQNQIPVENIELLVQFRIWDEIQLEWIWSDAVFMVEFAPGLYIRDGAEFDTWDQVNWRAILPTYVEPEAPETWSFQPPIRFSHFNWRVVDLR